MITKDNLIDVVNQLDEKSKARITNSDKEFCVLFLYTFNGNSYTSCILTNNFTKYANVSNNGNCILNTETVKTILK